VEKRDPNNRNSFNFDEKGSNVVSQQIMNSYNSGFMGEETALANQDDFNAGTGPAEDESYGTTQG
jgi:hypothetical protein